MNQNRGVADARYKKIRALLAQAATQTPPTGLSAASFVFRPGGASAPGVFTTPAALKAALLTIDSAAYKTIVVDPQFGAAHLTVAESPWPLNNATLLPVWNSAAALTIDAGVSFSPDTSRVTFDYGLAVTCNAGASGELSTIPADGFLLVEVLRDAHFENTTVHPAISAPAGTFMSLKVWNEAHCGDGVHPVVTAAGTLIAEVFLESILDVASVTGGGVLNANIDATSSAQGSGAVIVLADDAAKVGYTVADATKWVGAPPTTVKQALDRIAANTTNAHPIP